MIARFTLLLALLAPLPLPAQELPAGFGWFRSVVGHCWTGLLPDGSTQHTHCYSSQFGKFIRGTSTLARVRDGNQTILFDGDSLFAWDERNARITYYIWGSDGSHRQLEAQHIGEELVFPVPTRADPAKTAYRSVWRVLHTESIEVRRERPTEDSWTTEFNVVYQRAPKKD